MSQTRDVCIQMRVSIASDTDTSLNLYALRDISLPNLIFGHSATPLPHLTHVIIRLSSAPKNLYWH